MDIREFYKSTQNNQTQNNDFSNNFNSNRYSSNNNQGNSPHSQKDFSEYTDTINKYKDLSQQELYSELLNQASNLKSQGKLNNEMLSSISSTLGPMLNDEQKQLLSNIIKRLK